MCLSWRLHIPAAGVLLHPLDLFRSCSIFWGMGYDETFLAVATLAVAFLRFSSHLTAGGLGGHDCLSFFLLLWRHRQTQ
jgi:hypothetical protein